MILYQKSRPEILFRSQKSKHCHPFAFLLLQQNSFEQRCLSTVFQIHQTGWQNCRTGTVQLATLYINNMRSKCTIAWAARRHYYRLKTWIWCAHWRITIRLELPFWLHWTTSSTSTARSPSPSTQRIIFLDSFSSPFPSLIYIII